MYESLHFKADTSDKLSCPCCGSGGLSVALLIVLEEVREHFGQPVKVTSGARCYAHNLKVGGVNNSRHLTLPERPHADAADIQVANTDPMSVWLWLANRHYGDLLGLGQYKTFTHVDVRGHRARW